MVPPIIKDLLRIKKLDISLGIFIGIILVSIVGSALFYPNPEKKYVAEYAQLLPPSPRFPLGTDGAYRDVLATLINGIKNSFYIGFTAALISLAIGVLFGVIAGFKGGIIDSSLMVGTDVILAFPIVLVMLLAASLVSSDQRTPMLVSTIIGATGWPWVARAIRSQIMSLKTREFMYMSRMAGLGDMRIIFEDLLPNMASYLFMAFVLLMSISMIAEAGLSVIGLTTNSITLGNVLRQAQLDETLRRKLWWHFLPPGACLVAMTSSLLLMSTALDEFFSPRLKGG